MPTTALILNYGIGNALKVSQFLRYQGFNALPINKMEEAEGFDSAILIVPGIGHFDACAIAARQSGADEIVKEWHLMGKAVLGICVGAQLLLESSEEGEEYGFGLIQGKVLSNKRMNTDLNVGRKSVTFNDPRYERLNSSRYYFSHNYFLSPSNRDSVMAFDSSNFPAVIKSGNVVGVQFHPEKSGPIGSNLVKALIAEVVT
jgi:glutamine amidotransferase